MISFRAFVSSIIMIYASCSMAQISLSIKTKRFYYPDLPIEVVLSVSNTNSKALSVNSIKHGSPFIKPVKVYDVSGKALSLASVSKSVWRKSIHIKKGEAAEGLIDIAPYLNDSDSSRVYGLAPGVYTVIFAYQPYSDKDSRLLSKPIKIKVIEPAQNMVQAQKALNLMRKVRLDAKAVVPPAVLSLQRQKDNPYWVETRILYARWLTRTQNSSAAIEVLQNLLEINNLVIRNNELRLKLDLAGCYLANGEKVQSLRMYKSIREESDLAYGMIHIINGTKPKLEE